MTLSICKIEVHGIKENGDMSAVVRDKDADFFGLFGLVEGEVNSFYVAIGDFPDRGAAELVRDLLDNKSKGIPP